MKKIILIILFSAIMFVSVRYSGIVYRFYLKTYYNYFYTEEELVKKGWALYDDGEYEKLHDYLTPVLDIYITNTEFKQIAGLNYIKMGEPVKGAEYFAASFENGGSETADIIKIIKILFKNENYGEVVFFYDRKLMLENVNTAFYYGASLYHVGRNKEAFMSLMSARKNGFIGEEIDYYTGLALEGEGRLKEASDMLFASYKADSYNIETRKALIRVYRKNSEFEKAEYILRRR
ncbi:MAG TPA: hypothetical protein P5120_01400 [Spirochaetota bacterium]|nr:hypothetical protein [Spirochaetota bacterium]